ncbi:O-antigen ligase family protein [Patescibacteria group bacterium]|nr:O-antigen ligase family protein [Patescibacteria group bacterium]MBU4452821.1 O-antigen ligase family protein [Patescibacteria group bacterium]MCG2687239.1 O-antigen ligase family protein [Candidatus Parcubacteria bacterium]
MKMSKQFVGKTMVVTLCGIAIMHSLAFFVRDTSLELILLIAFGIFALVLTWRSQLNGLLLAFAEIFTGGHGHLLDVDVFGFSLSLRILIFAIVMGVWLIRFAQIWAPRLLKEGLACSSVAPKERRTGVVTEGLLSRLVISRDTPWLLLTLAVVIGTAVGFLQNDPRAVFDDMNGYVTICYLLPLLTINWTLSNKRRLLQVFFASLVWIIGFSVVLVYAFTHLDGKELNDLYTFVRDSRLAEVTLQVIDNKGSAMEVYATNYYSALSGQYWYRIFMPSQLVEIFGALLLYSGMIYLWRKERLQWFVTLFFMFSILTLLLSLSRSFLLGTAVGGLSIFISAFWFGSHKLWIIRRTLLAILLSIVSIFFIYAIVQVAVPIRPDLSDAAFFQTSAQTGRVEAVVSRWNLLDEMIVPIAERPILGSGFGKTVSYNSEDPRILSELGGQEYTTYRFEWGWHDIWLKMGLLGLLAFTWYLVTLLRAGWLTMQSKGYKWLVAGLIGGIIALFVANTFSPYLNHPLGIGFMLFVIPFVDWEGFARKQKQKVDMPENEKKLITQPSTVVASKME